MRKSWIAAAAVLVTASLLWADGKPGVVKTRDGGVYDGTIDERDTTVVVNVRGIDTTIARDNIVSITYGGFEERWQADYDKLDAKDVAGHIAAARRAFDQHNYDLTEKALRDAQYIDPNNAEAAELLKLTINQRKLERGRAASSDSETPTTTQESTPIKPPPAYTTLSNDDINRIKQVEAREGDTKLRVSFANNVRKKFYDATPGLSGQYPTYSDFAKEPAVVQAVRILHDGTPEMAKDVKITNDPEMIATFRRDVMPLVLQNCATSLCHGGSGAAASKFALVTPAADTNAVYTNFYVLQSYSTKVTPAGNSGNAPPSVLGSTIQPTVGYMMDRTRPEMSLLLQYGLSDTVAELKHPHVRGYTGIFRGGRDDRSYKTILAFLQTLNPVQPDYGINFKLQRRETLPATQP